MESTPEIPGTGNRPLNRAIAMTVVLLSVSMALTKIKGDNIVQAMQADTAARVDMWNGYQAVRVKLHVEQVAATGYRLSAYPAAGAAAAASDTNVARYRREETTLKAQAQAADEDDERQGQRDDQCDLSDGFASIALAITAIATQVESWGLLGVARRRGRRASCSAWPASSAGASTPTRCWHS